MSEEVSKKANKEVSLDKDQPTIHIHIHLGCECCPCPCRESKLKERDYPNTKPISPWPWGPYPDSWKYPVDPEIYKVWSSTSTISTDTTEYKNLNELASLTLSAVKEVLGDSSE